MAIIVITIGSQGKNPNVPDKRPRQFAHQWQNDDPADVPHQASNFLNYARALGNYEAPIVLLGGKRPDDPTDAACLEVQLDGWRSIVQTATGMAVEIR